MLSNVVIGTIVGRADELLGTFAEDTIGGRRRLAFAEAALVPDGKEYLPGVDDPVKKDRARTCLTEIDPLLSYKARPLNGIWATAPYLHNGSVPTLYDLLLPSSLRNVAEAGAPAELSPEPRRPERFFVGSREFDPNKVGLNSTAGTGAFEFRVRDDRGAPILGNYNSGHDYGNAALDDSQRMMLIEYMKTL
jgi:hypothetical protein